MEITATLVKQLRDRTGLGMMDCKTALLETDGNFEEAIDYLRKKGMETADNKTNRDTKEGVIGYYIHANNKIGVLLEINCETDFAAKTVDFYNLAHDVAMHVAASDPKYLDIDEIPMVDSMREKRIIAEQLKNQNKPDHIIEKIVEGKMKKFYREKCLLHQPFVKEPKISVGDHIKQVISQLGENISIKRFTRYELGE